MFYMLNILRIIDTLLKLIQTRYECFRFLNQEYQADPKLQACHFLGIQKQCASIIDGKRLSLTPVPSQINKEIKTATSEPSAQGDYKTTLEDCSTFINSLKLNNLPLSLQACNTKGKLAEQKIALHAALKTLAKRIDTNEGYLGTPPVGTPALKSFYGQIKYYLSDIQKHLDPLKDAEEYLQLLLAADVCGGGLLAHLDQLHTRLCSADSSLSAEAICAKLIGGEIKLFIESKNQDRNVHTNNTYQRLLKDYIGGPDVFNDPFGPTINPMDLLEMLFREITVSRILEELARDLKNNEPLKERLIEYIEDRLFEGKELEQKDKDTFQEEFNGQLKALIESKERCGPNIPSFEVLQAVAQTDRITVLKKKCPNLDSEILNAILTNRDKIIPLVTEVIPQLKNLTGLSSQALLTMDEQNIQLAFEGNTPKRAEQFYAEQFRKKYRDGDGNFNQDGLAIVLEHMGLIRNLGPD